MTIDTFFYTMTLQFGKPLKAKKLLLTAVLCMVSCGNALAGIGVSYDQAMQYYKDQFHMKQSSLANGSDRYMGMTPDNLAVLEIVGRKNDISQASIMIGIPNDSPKTVARNTLLMLRFLKNTVPEWPNSADWAGNTVKKLARGGGEIETIIKGRKKISMQLVLSLGMVITTVKEN